MAKEDVSYFQGRRQFSPPDLDQVGFSPVCTNAVNKPKVSFNVSPDSTKAVTPYSKVYGRHPSEFNFDAEGNMVSESSLSDEEPGCLSRLASALRSLIPCGRYGD
mmetsp:Transcript_77196/g.174636  ORF Transcript_77196/g.174636 Transcript_77196/m.174636 type:complete len:105 (-) Transcript_77196:135-449(-)